MNGSEARKLYGTFRCPVCGHRDGVEVEGGRGGAEVSCSYCDTTLELQGGRAWSGRFEARVSRGSERESIRA